ncbi:MAG: chromosomal replication initiator protein DnaA [Patescibacteria group bacterium]|jgi:chromosomal replication initiator protein
MLTDQEKLWQTVLGEIEVGMSPANFQTWFKNTSLETIDTQKGVVTIRVPNDFTKSWLQKKYQKEMHKCLVKHLGRVIMVQYVVGSKKPVAPEPTKMILPTLEATDKKLFEPENVVREGLNPKFTFESFVVGENSKLCYAAAEAVAKNPGMNYNPLFIYGGVGLGKTHLLQAIGNETVKTIPKAKVVYVTSERFTNEMIEAIRGQKTKEFKDKYRKVDCLLIDDVQFIAGKEQTQEEFFHTFNALHTAGKQIVLTSDRPPKAIPQLEDRLRSRFEWGMIADISTPSYETRLAILQSKLEGQKRELARDILEYLAKSITNNVRELEGALTRIFAFAELNNATPELDDVKNLMGGILTAPGKRVVRPSEIIRAVIVHFNIKKEDLTGRQRTREIVVPRQILVYLLREEVEMPYKQIGGELGGRDHTTIMHDYNKIKEEILKNDIIHQEITQIKNKLYAVD